MYSPRYYGLLVLLGMMFFPFGSAQAFFEKDNPYQLVAKNPFADKKSAAALPSAPNAPPQLAASTANPVWYNEVTSFFDPPNLTAPVPMLAPAPVANVRRGNDGLDLSQPMPPIGAMRPSTPPTMPPMQPPMQAVNSAPSLAATMPPPVAPRDIPANSGWARTYDTTFPNLASVPNNPPPAAIDNSWQAQKAELQQQNQAAQQMRWQSWDLANTGSAPTTPQTVDVDVAWPKTQVFIADENRWLNPDAAQPVAMAPLVPPAKPLGMAPQPAPQPDWASQPMPSLNSYNPDPLPQAVPQSARQPAPQPSSLPGLSWPPVTAEAPTHNLPPTIMNPAPVLVQSLTPQAAATTPDWQQPMPSLALPTANSSDNLRTPGQTMVSADPTGQNVRNQFGQSIQQSAPYTSGVAQYPFGYAGMGQPKIDAQTLRRIPRLEKPIATIYFRDESANVDEQSRRVIGQVADWMKNQGGGLRVLGHASARTADMSPMRQAMGNYRISLERADSVSRALRQAGVPSEKIQLRAFGDNDPAYSESMPSGEAWNRRVEIYWDMF